MSKHLKFLLIGCIILVTPHSVFADYVVNTGPGNTFVSGVQVKSTQWVAGQFTLNQSFSTIVDIEGWFALTGGTITVAIYGNNFNSGSPIPDSNISYGSWAFSVLDMADYDPNNSTIDPDTPDSFGWAGVSGVSLNLSAGTYWAAFEVRSGQNYNGFMPDMYDENDNPLSSDILAEYAWWRSPRWRNANSSYETFGLRIGNPVPIPSALLLLASGLLGIAGFNKRKQK
ncbi:MAG: hypothetical protein K8S13_21570 [Desulfobacula sp.]|uniref:hypothetical protein n=1 Tax=Desulfobacula sp. TaxID=2593537 RepID=UPI0025BFF16B|nr:hypothetical protein [Desulfobacula sp.]MCD4722421.1 hypothetical protein [Desulfobacula sp.]